MIKNKIEMKDLNFFKNNQEYIRYINDKYLVEELIIYLKDLNIKLEINKINKLIINDFINNENIILTANDLHYINENSINSAEKLINLLNKNKDLSNYIINRAVNLKIDKNIIKESIENVNFEIKIMSGFEYINIYL